MKKIFSIMCLCVFLSCSQNNSIKREIIKLNSKPVILPIDATINYNGRDTIINNLFDSKYKFVVYFNSEVCSSCQINKIHLWKTMINYSKTLNSKLMFYFIFNTDRENIRNLNLSLLTNKLDYPVLIDTNGDFERLNPHLPKNKALHTFLLDENNKVILVGNPLQNKNIEKLFYEKTEALLSK